MQKTYLGDSVYAAYDGYQIILTTENGCGPSNRICLEPAVLGALALYQKDIARHRERIHTNTTVSPKG